MKNNKELVTNQILINTLVLEYNKYIESWNEFDNQENENYRKTGRFNCEFKYSGPIGVMSADEGRPKIVIYFRDNPNRIYKISTKGHSIWKDIPIFEAGSFLKLPLTMEQVTKVWKEEIHYLLISN
jgi:hypothetical protein